MSISKYLLERKFKITITDDYVDILNYQEVSLFDDNHIVIKHNNSFLSIVGNDLTIIKWLDDEVLVAGEVIKIELR